MGELAKVEEGPALTDLQRRFVEAVTAGVPNEEAVRVAGYAEGTNAIHVLRGTAVQAALNAWCDARLAGDLRMKALQALEELVKSGPAATRFNAAKLILETQREADKTDDKPDSSMSIEELEALIARKEAQLKDVTPKNGA